MVNIFRERRKHSRINATCPVLFSTTSAIQWTVGVMGNLSDCGLQFVSHTPIKAKTSLLIQCKPGCDNRIPSMTGQVTVTRCERQDNGEYLVACMLTQINRSDSHHPSSIPTARLLSADF